MISYPNARIVWAYMSEVILSLLVVWHAQRWLPYSAVQVLIVDYIATWTTTCTILFAARVALWVLFMNLLTRPFGEWLEDEGMLDTFQRALSWPLYAFLACIIMCLVAKWRTNPYTVYATVGCLAYVFVNMSTMISNTQHLLRLAIAHQRASKQAVPPKR